mmetsp:Transcript_25174/g.72798  ORF Transcript_25174/g.72798 Transcript_25174/m.72798 type:complete len:317 (-) Transcript_25174:214-1164(-)
MSDSSDSDGHLSLDDDPFSFAPTMKKTAHRGAGKKRDRSSGSSSSSSSSAEDSDSGASDDSDDSSGEYRRSASSKAKQGRGRVRPRKKVGAGKRKRRNSGDRDSFSSDSDDSSTSPSASAPAAAAAAANKKKTNKTESLLLSSDDDDDDDDGVGGTSGIQVSSEIIATLREAREARQRLRAAQDASKGVDDSFIDVSDDSISDGSEDEAGKKDGGDGDDDDDDDVVLVGGTASSANASLGPAIRITLRVNALKIQFMKKIRMTDQLKKLDEPIRKECAIQAGCKIELHFDGQAMDLDGTPATYDIEDEDMIDVVVK